MTRYVSIADFHTDVNVANAYSIYTINPIELWGEGINGYDLAVGIIGTADRVTLQDWYLGLAHQVEEIRKSGSRKLSHAIVDQLEQTMAAFTTLSTGRSLLTQPQLRALAPMLTANWQVAA